MHPSGRIAARFAIAVTVEHRPLPDLVLAPPAAEPARRRVARAGQLPRRKRPRPCQPKDPIDEHVADLRDPLRRHRRRRRRRLRPGGRRARRSCWPSSAVGRRARALARALSAAPGRPLRPRGRPHPAGLRARRASSPRSPSRPTSTSGATPRAGRSLRIGRTGLGPPAGPTPRCSTSPTLEALLLEPGRRAARRSTSGAGREVTGLDADGDGVDRRRRAATDRGAAHAVAGPLRRSAATAPTAPFARCIGAP